MKKVFAHYYTPTPPSINNAANEADSYYELGYLNPYGENNAHLSYGGYLRDKPVFREQLSGDYRLQDAITEIAHAKAAGIDGFTLNILTLTETDRNYLTMVAVIEAARLDGEFDIVLMPDMGGHFSVYPDALAPFIESIASNEAIFKLPDGRLLLSPYNAQNQEPTWWVAQFNYLESVGIDIAFMPVYQGWSQYATAFQTEYPTEFAKYFYGVSDWGVRTPTAAASRLSSNPVSAAGAMGLLWMQSVRVQDFRPKSRSFGEAKGTELLRTMFEGAIDQDAGFIQLVTWNDYGEHTHFSPSDRLGDAVLDISKYYISWFKSGIQPSIEDEKFYLVSRKQSVDVTLTNNIQTSLFSDADNETPVDILDVYSRLKEPLNLTYTIDGQSTTVTLPTGNNSLSITDSFTSVDVTLQREAYIVGEATIERVSGAIDVLDLLYDYKKIELPEININNYITTTESSLRITNQKAIESIVLENETIVFDDYVDSLSDISNNISIEGFSSTDEAFEPDYTYFWEVVGDAVTIDEPTSESTSITVAELGEFTLRLTVSDDLNLVESSTISNIVDTGSPVITLLGSSYVSLEEGKSYNELGAIALDSADGDISNNIVITNTVDINTIGRYEVRYNVSDSSGNQAVEVIRTVDVIDVTIPVITIVGEDYISIYENAVYEDAGATALDDNDGDLTDSIVVTSTVPEVLSEGVYEVRYNVSDSSGNAAVEVVRRVNILSATLPRVYAGPNQVDKLGGSLITLVGEAVVTNAEIATVLWENSQGIVLDVEGLTASFIAPVLETDVTYVFTLTVTDTNGLIGEPSTVSVKVKAELELLDATYELTSTIKDTFNERIDQVFAASFEESVDEEGTVTYKSLEKYNNAEYYIINSAGARILTLDLSNGVRKIETDFIIEIPNSELLFTGIYTHTLIAISGNKRELVFKRGLTIKAGF